MGRQLLAAGLLLAVCVLIHALGTLVIGHQLNRRMVAHAGAVTRHAFLLLIALSLFLFALHAVEMLIWATAYWWTDAPPSFDVAFYFSVSSYTTVGYGDVVLGPEWRTFGAAEAVVGVLLLGWSTALLFLVIQRLHRPVS
jgi:voltage-gated potassium channel